MENVTVNTEKLRTQISELSQKKGFIFKLKTIFVVLTMVQLIFWLLYYQKFRVIMC